jgi:hypothetical protein
MLFTTASPQKTGANAAPRGDVMSDNPSLPSPETMETADDAGSNLSANPAFADVAAARLSRRELIGNLMATSALAAGVAPALLAAGGEAQAQSPVRPAIAPSPTPNFAFQEIGAGVDDRLHVAPSYRADVLIRWGDKVHADAPAFTPGKLTAAAQAHQFGYNNDFLGYIPIRGSSRRGLLVVNHEYVNRELMFSGVKRDDVRRPGLVSREMVDVEMMAHGGSVLEIALVRGKWVLVEGSRYNRRITAETEMRISGPAAGHALMRTSADPTGTLVKGMLNNCAGGITPWGTWLTCEENFNLYFWGKADGHPAEKALKRYNVPANWSNWAEYYPRFDVGKEPNEANRFGWIVEIDPLDPKSVPVKRTALGRFKHEGAGSVVNGDGRFVVYSGDDERFDYVYKFVSDARVDPKDRAANRDILDRGTLFVARFDADGTGEWLPLIHGRGKLTAENGFRDQGEVLILTRLAADLLGATKMDRPEDIEINPRTGKAYLMLTNNDRRTAAQVDAANPRAQNRFGHIIEITPENGDHAHQRFRWEILVRCGDPADPAVGATFNPATSWQGWFGMPDNALVDADGRLWIATDGNSARNTGRSDGLWAMETQGAARGTSKHFLRVPVGAELCGPMMTPDMTTLFVAVQHPGEGGGSSFDKPSTRWPDFKDGVPPRPSIVAVTRQGGGKIGS